MLLKRLAVPALVGTCAVALCVSAFTSIEAQQPQSRAVPQAGRGGRGGSAANIFTAADANKDGAVTRDELKAAFARWLAAGDAGTGAVTQEQLAAAINAAFPAPAAPPAGAGRGAPAAQPRTPKQADVDKMMAALPDKAYAKPRKPRKVLVLCKTAGFVHSCIPLVARTVEEMGKKTGAWTTDVTYDSADINAGNLEQYDLLFLNNNTGQFLDDPGNAAVTEARRKALLDFVRSAARASSAIHAASDAYHQDAPNGRAAGRKRGLRPRRLRPRHDAGRPDDGRGRSRTATSA